MAIKPLTLREYTYQSDSDSAKGTKNATDFKLKTYQSRVATEINDSVLRRSKDGNLTFLTHELHWLTTKFGLAGWSNLKDEKGKEIKFKSEKYRLGDRDYDVASDESLNLLPLTVINELANVIAENNAATGEEIKNSEG